MRKIRKIIVHCTAGRASQRASEVVAYHMRPVSAGGRGWHAPGYHYIVEADGQIVRTWPEESISNGCKGHNAESINVCYTGGVDFSRPGYPAADTRTDAQRRSLRRLLTELAIRYPEAVILGHRDLAAKACPSFDAKREYADLRK